MPLDFYRILPTYFHIKDGKEVVGVVNVIDGVYWVWVGDRFFQCGEVGEILTTFSNFTQNKQEQ